jgi:hypothetical protein
VFRRGVYLGLTAVNPQTTHLQRSLFLAPFLKLSRDRSFGVDLLGATLEKISIIGRFDGLKFHLIKIMQ